MTLLAESPTDRAEQLVSLSTRLTELLDLETAAFNRQGNVLAPNLADEKNQLANTYRLELMRIAQDRSLIAGAPAAVRASLEKATRRLQESVKENSRAVLKVKTVSEGLVKAIGDEIAKNRGSPVGYGPKLGAPAARGAATAITLNRVV
ncbi:MAG: flagellar basal body protein [Caulobacterales bacterium]